MSKRADESSCSIELYVYYKADRALAGRIRATVAQHEGVRLLLREDGDTAVQTWMEIHGGPDAEAGERQLALAMAAWLGAPRHVERFRPLNPA